MTSGNNEDSHPETHGTRLSALAVYEAIRRDGEGELTRPPLSLWWLGVAAGFAISISVLAKGFLHSKLPEASWRPLVENFGYAFGFVVVILGRMQLFTENTITVVLPAISEWKARVLALSARLWLIVLIANVVGTGLAALVIYYGFSTPEQLHAMLAISKPLLAKPWLDVLLQAIPAGFLVAAIVWMLPNGRGFELWMILLTAYLIGIGSFPHVIVGSVEAFLLLLDGSIDIFAAMFRFFLPAVAGNIIGGTVLFSVLAYGQVRKES